MMDEIEIIFALMPFKHTGRYDFIFNYLHKVWLPHNNKVVSGLPVLQKFYIDTYKKAFTQTTVRWSLIKVHDAIPYDAKDICDYHPDRYDLDEWSVMRDAYDEIHTKAVMSEQIIAKLPTDKQTLVSLSGGVDSMVMLALLARAKAPVHAVHIVYGNRKQSEDEYNFLVQFCAKLGVPLWVYRIKWLKRGEIDRQFYEDITRDLRFMTYRAVGQMIGQEEPRVLMGHIKDDIVENIWTNIAHCHHLGNLKKMEAEEVQLGVRIMRPLLTEEKDDIYRVSADFAIPFLKNTTPSWSNRGKFREHFHRATLEQFGEGIDSKVIEFAEAIQKQASLLNMLLYDPIYESFNENKVNITTAVKAKLDAAAWLTVFEHICHKNLGVSRPSIKCVRDFSERLYRPWTVLNVEMGKHFRIRVKKESDVVIMEFVLV
jgi:tRNA(Ile)-lysidine synthetase-like protein